MSENDVLEFTINVRHERKTQHLQWKDGGSAAHISLNQGNGKKGYVRILGMKLGLLGKAIQQIREACISNRDDVIAILKKIRK